ncbi:MAG: 16S rRNA (guanine(527)-N(7))-methyltransferase RsmG [Blautia sp.]|nr:16S rRNA (guanine(527)-N(7))-methyltransferase RsmG [Blautia sp.]
MIYDLSPLRSSCEKFRLQLNSKQENQFILYYEYLIEKNKVMNLTGITEFQDVLIKHFVDSISCVRSVDFCNIRTIIDIGTGAGFPGIPLKIMFPDIELCLLDSLNKRVNFLKEAINMLQLNNVEAIHGRAEDFAKNKQYREKFDLCVSRAVSNLSTLSEYCLPYVKVGGKFVSYKSGQIQEEADQSQIAIRLLGGKCERIDYFKLQNTDIERSLVIIDKVKSTPVKYPRKAGTPLKEPL